MYHLHSTAMRIVFDRLCVMYGSLAFDAKPMNVLKSACDIAKLKSTQRNCQAGAKTSHRLHQSIRTHPNALSLSPQIKFIEPAEEHPVDAPLPSSLPMSPRGTIKEKILPSPHTTSPTPPSAPSSFLHRVNPFPPPPVHAPPPSFGTGAASHSSSGSPAPPSHGAPRRTATTPSYSSPSMIRTVQSNSALQSLETTQEGDNTRGSSTTNAPDAAVSHTTKTGTGKKVKSPRGMLRSASFHSLHSRNSPAANGTASATVSKSSASSTLNPPGPHGNGSSSMAGTGSKSGQLRPSTSSGKALLKTFADSKKAGPSDIYMPAAPHMRRRASTLTGIIENGGSGDGAVAPAASLLATAAESLLERRAAAAGRGGSDTMSSSGGGAGSSACGESGGSELVTPLGSSGNENGEARGGSAGAGQGAYVRFSSGRVSATGEGDRSGSSGGGAGSRGEAVQVWSDSAVANEAWGAGTAFQD